MGMIPLPYSIQRTLW